MKLALYLGVLYTLSGLPTPVSAQASKTKRASPNVAVNPNDKDQGTWIPTLIYNCAKLPAICTNVNRRDKLTPKGGVGQWGQLQGNDHIELTFDTDTSARDRRRNSVCPERWKRDHDCPEKDQPVTVPQGASYSSGSFAVSRYNPNNNKKKGDSGFNTIANSAGGNSGMIWTCDEWPPASTVEGGAGNAMSYCAPQSGSCGGTVPGVTYVRSEQDFQSSSHTVLRLRVSGQNNPTGLWRFHFKTLYNDSPDSAATALEWYSDASTGLLEKWLKRQTSNPGPSHFMVDEIFSNGTMATRGYTLTEQESSTVHKRTLDAMRKLEVDRVLEMKALRRRANSTNATNSTITPHSPARQLYEELSIAPLLPVIEITRTFVQDQLLGYLSSSQSYLNQTLASLGIHLNSTKLSKARSASPLFGRDSGMGSQLAVRQTQTGPAACGPGNPCSDGSCCNSQGHCGYGPDNCGNGCQSNCNATAACGRDSAGGNVSCPLNVCCSYYGFCGVESDFCNSPNPQQPCQKGFGSCQQIAAPSCGGSSASGRSLAYYQVANVREHPSSFQVIPGDPADVSIYPNFTGLQNSGLQTWVAIGGWDFNDPGKTQTTFSDIASSASNRATFISSLKSFLTKYKFQGVDLDWEYPGAPDRAGKPADTQNLVQLLKEMRASFGTSLGISATLPASYWYLRWFDPISMQQYVDFFNLMTYDLHGPWDAGVKQIGKTVLGQTNIPEIYNWTLPLWYDNLNPAKINMGLAYYGRGYTLADSSCNTIGCKWSGVSRPGPCTNFGGVMSLQELTDSVIPSLGIQPTLLKDAMMKQLTWSDQWIGYDDLETIAMKKAWASQHCFGGTMIWSIDLFSGEGSGTVPDGQGTGGGDPGSGGGQGGGGDAGGGSDTLVYIDPSIWSSTAPVINCRPPCTFVLPPYQLPKPTTISFPPYSTSLEVAWSVSGTLTTTVEQTVLSIPPVTTTQIEVWAYTVTNTNNASTVSSSFYVTSSVRPPPFVITDDPNPQRSSGVSHAPVTRTITPPPYPYTFTSPNGQATTTTSSGGAVVIFPIVTYKPGPPGPPCKSKCGTKCLFFCNHPCLLDCTDGGQDFPDPIDPSPKPKSMPKPTNDPEPTGSPIAGSVVDPQQTAPVDPETEEEDDECALELGIPLPDYDGTIGQPSPTVTIVSQTATPASPSPPAPTTSRATPNPATESLRCYNSGSMQPRSDMINAINAFCNRYSGVVLDASDSGSSHYLENVSASLCRDNNESCNGLVTVSVTAINNCIFTIDGPNPSDQCGRILRKAVDQCDTTSTKFKQGGIISSNCAQWRIDPNYKAF